MSQQLQSMASGLPDLKQSVAILAQADRDLRNAESWAKEAKAKGTLTATHVEVVERATRNRDMALECFLVSWGAWVGDAEGAQQVAQ